MPNELQPTHSIHTSERRSFRGCRRRWNWAYREGYLPDVTPRPLEFGIAVHTALEHFYHPDNWDKPTNVKLELAIAAFAHVCEQQRWNYLTLTNQRELDQASGDDYQQRIDLGLGMLRYHANYTHPKLDNWFRPVAVEIPFEVPLFDDSGSPLQCTNSPYCGQLHDNPSEVTYGGRVDMLIEDLRFGGYFVWDHKTAATLSSDDGFLQLDDQIASYCWALRHILQLDIRGFVYAEYRKAFPSPPTRLKRASGGRLFSTAKNQATSLAIFLETVRQEDGAALEAGYYDDYLDFLDSPEASQYHQRFTIIKTDRELENIGESLTIEAQDIVDPSLRIYPSVGRYGCSTCSYRQPCVAQFRSEDYVYTLDSLFIKVK